MYICTRDFTLVCCFRFLSQLCIDKKIDIVVFFSFVFTFCVLQEWRALLCDPVESVKFTKEALEGYQLLLECRNEHRNLSMEAVLIERHHRLLSAHSTLSIVKEPTGLTMLISEGSDSFYKMSNVAISTFKTPRTPLIRSHSLSILDSFSSESCNNSNLSFISASGGLRGATTPILGYSAGALPTTASSIAASVSRRRLSLRRQMTGLRFDPADTISASFSSLESDNSFMSIGAVTTTAAVSSNQLSEDLMSGISGTVVNQSMMLIDETDIEAEADCEFVRASELETLESSEEEDMLLDSD